MKFIIVYLHRLGIVEVEEMVSVYDYVVFPNAFFYYGTSNANPFVF